MSAIKAKDVEIVWVDYVGNDWLAIYVHGEKVYEGHPPDVDDAFALFFGTEPKSDVFPSGALKDKRRMRGMPQRWVP